MHRRHMKTADFTRKRDECFDRGILYDDADFTPSTDNVFVSAFHLEHHAPQLTWHRPKELCQQPRFVVDNMKRLQLRASKFGES